MNSITTETSGEYHLWLRNKFHFVCNVLGVPHGE